MLPDLRFSPMTRLIFSRRCLLAFTALLLALPGRAVAQDAPAADGPVVKIVIDFGDGLQWQYGSITHKPGMTVLDAMNQAAARTQRPLRFEHKGSGESAFLISIDGSANEGGGKAKRNWFYRVNDKLGDTSFGLKRLEAGDSVLWRFGKYNPGEDS